MKTIRTIKQNATGITLHGTPVTIVEMNGGAITIECQGSRHRLIVSIAPDGQTSVTTPDHDAASEKYQRTMDALGNSGESECECLRVKDWFQGCGICIS